MIKATILSLIILAATASAKWEPNFDIALNKAQKENKLVLLNFSGSDWCGPCIKMHKTILESEAFLQATDSLLYMVNADFPRSKKNALAKDLVKQNEKLADKYNKDGNFPYTLLVDGKGKVLKVWNGCPDETPEQFASEVAAVYKNIYAK